MRSEKPMIAEEQIISPLPVQQHFHARILSELEDFPLGPHTRRTERFILMPGHGIEHFKKFAQVRIDVMSLHTGVTNNDIDMVTLIKPFLGGASRKGVLVGSNSGRS